MSKRKTLQTAQTQCNLFLPSQIDPEPLLNLTKPQPSRALIESACHQIEFGIAETAMLYKALAGGEQYNLLLRWGYQLVSRAMSSNEIMAGLHSLALAAVAVGWVACESGVQSTLLNQLVSESAKDSAGIPKSPDDGGKPGRKAGER